MRRWSEVAERVAATTRTSEKTTLLADHLAGLTSAELPIATVFLTGRPFAEADQRATGLGWSAIATTVTDLAGVPRSALGEAYDRSSDLGRAVEDVLALAGHHPDAADSPTLPEVAAAYAGIEAASGPAAKSGILRALLARADPLTAKYIVKVLSGELRIGLREGLVEAAIAKAFDRPIDAVKWAGMLTGDIGRMAELARDGRLEDATLALFNPIKFMLASPAEDAAEIVKRLGVPVWVEDKYDGIRAQLHRRGHDIRLYSRDLHDISNQFPEVVDGARGLAWDGILDGEILAWRDGVVLPFIALQARLGRKSPSAAIRAEVPVIYVAFDVLGLGRGGDAPVEALLREPLEDRRRTLESLELPLAGKGGAFALSHLVSVTSEDALEDAFLGARERRNEGLMVKDPRSIYSPGRRGLGWLKMKKALATIDCVVVGVEVGHGKRHGVLSDYTFAVRDTENDQLVTIGKAYSGLTDAEIAEMTAWFEAHTIARYGRYRQVEPTVVVEVAFDVIVRSRRHQSGYSLRFPRIANLRPDKPVDEIDTLETVRALYEGLQHGAEQLVTAGART
jgi:ATP-dependent DNA ligase